MNPVLAPGVSRACLTAAMAGIFWGAAAAAPTFSDVPSSPLSTNPQTPSPVDTTLAVPAYISDHMVLQRDRPVALRGKAEPGRQVVVRLAPEEGSATGSGPSAVESEWTGSAAAGREGEWEVELPARPAGGPYGLTIESAGARLHMADVWFGEVWVAGGQSNMEWKVDWGIVDREKVVQEADRPLIRFFEVPNEVRATPLDWQEQGRWKVAGPGTVGEFSAVAWFFARHLNTEHGVPVGILEADWGGTPAEAWTPARALLELDGYREAGRRMLDGAADWEARIEANKRSTELKFERIGSRELAESVFRSQIATGAAPLKPVTLPTQEPLHDFAWLVREIDVPCGAGGCAGPGRLVIGDVVQEAFVFWNGDYLGQKEWTDAGIDMEIPEERMRAGANRLAIRVANSWDNRVRVGGPGGMRLEWGDAAVDLEGRWEWTAQAEPPMPPAVRMEWNPSFLYNAMIHPLRRYPVRGVIWYQGESNTDRAAEYRELFSTMIGAWRDAWSQPELPFLYVQLANYQATQDGSEETAWPELRQAQREVLGLPATGMAVAIDIGEAGDIHPRNKQDVGRRLWLQARKVAYGEDSAADGPVPLRAWLAGPISEAGGAVGDAVGGVFGDVFGGGEGTPRAGSGAVLVSFETGGRAMSGGAADGVVKGFELAGLDGVFHPAAARIEGDRIRLESAQVGRPAHVRYAWADNPSATLAASDGLPAAPFRLLVEARE